ncbi:hypothetical protein BBK36DRAFT_1141801 [Trichoderma citrinoviride]|uniref:Histone chaperone domain-containing protein n=1 Tax=Trichoderma citrinoviride TaxID=58853 RepID=A0A2T4B9I4_9HYPO|nr:hypothetical protein BBK36DRAFT_1141801 [Trichoderma citrinoviride]PTB65871.1 hypothetical protein BBK36DRAFT_1141801 [Trichoderma citrinoviride]
MSKYAHQQIDDKDTNDTLGADVPEGQVQDDSYVTGTKNESVPVQSDDAPVEDPIKASSADSDRQLEQDDREAIDKSNIIDEKIRGAKPRGSYREPGDDQLGLTE